MGHIILNNIMPATRNFTIPSTLSNVVVTSINFTNTSNNNNNTGVVMDTLDIAYVTLTFVMSLMSILGCFVVLLVHGMYKDLRTSGRNMLVHLTVADLLTAIGNLLGVIWYLNVDTMVNKMAYCKFHSALTIMSSIASFIWTVVIAFFVFWIVLRKRPTNTQRRQTHKKIILPVVCWGIPLIIAMTALCEDVLGYDKALSQASWCWIDPTTEYALLWMLVTGKAWELGACVMTVCLYTSVKIMLFKQAQKRLLTVHQPNRQIDEANTKLTFVPLVFIVIRIWGTIRFLLGEFAHEFASSSKGDWIVILQGTGDSAQGFANFVIYCFFTSKIRNRLLKDCPCHMSVHPCKSISLGPSSSSDTNAKNVGRKLTNRISPKRRGSDACLQKQHSQQDPDSISRPRDSNQQLQHQLHQENSNTSQDVKEPRGKNNFIERQWVEMVNQNDCCTPSSYNNRVHLSDSRDDRDLNESDTAMVWSTGLTQTHSFCQKTTHTTSVSPRAGNDDIRVTVEVHK